MELHFSSPSCVPFCAHSPAEANELQQGKDENSSAQRPPLGREAQITKINGQIPGNAPCGLCGLDLWGRLWTGPETKQTADKAAPIPVKLQDVLPTQSWLSLHCTELFRCQLGMGAAECSNCSNLQMPAAREAGDMSEMAGAHINSSHVSQLGKAYVNSVVRLMKPS